MRVLITGGSGFLGSHVVEEFLAAGEDVTIFDRVRPVGAWVGDAAIIVGDLLDLAQVSSATRGMDVICHLAGVGDVYAAAAEPPTAAAYNVVGTANVAEAARRSGVGKLVYASTWEVYGHPRTAVINETHPCTPDHPYNITKYAGELLALAYDRLHDVPTLALRLGTGYGARMRPNSVFSRFVSRARDGQPIEISGSGEQTRQFTHARDIAHGFHLAAVSGLRGRAFNLVAQECISILRLAELLVAHFPCEIRFGPARPGDIEPAIVDSTQARDYLGWEPRVSFRDGLQELVLQAVPVAT